MFCVENEFIIPQTGQTVPLSPFPSLSLFQLSPKIFAKEQRQKREREGAQSQVSRLHQDTLVSVSIVVVVRFGSLRFGLVWLGLFCLLFGLLLLLALSLGFIGFIT